VDVFSSPWTGDLTGAALDDVTVNADPPAGVAEPGTLLLLALGTGVLGLARRGHPATSRG
jgi:hypothetical protein